MIIVSTFFNYFFYLFVILLQKKNLQLVNAVIDYDLLRTEFYNFQTFRNKQDLINSHFWKNIHNYQINLLKNSTIIILNDTQTAFFFRNDFLNPDKKYQYVSWYKKTIDFVSNKFIKKKLHNNEVNLLEIDYDEKQLGYIYDIPVSYCISSKLSSAGAELTHIFTKEKKKTLSIIPLLTTKLFQLGYSLMGGIDEMLISLKKSSMTTCKVSAGKRLQIFHTYKYSHFPNSKMRNVVFDFDNNEWKQNEWKKIEDYDPKLKNLGIFFIDFTSPINIRCTYDEDLLKCENSGFFEQIINNPLEIFSYKNLKYKI